MALYIPIYDKNENKEINKSVNAIYKTTKDEDGNVVIRTIGMVYKGSKLIWQYIRSCFGRGYWINDKPWSNTDAWKN